MRTLTSIALAVLAACGTNETPQPAPVPTLPDCVPNRDGIITPDELPVALGATLDFYAAANRTVDLTATGGVYDLSQENAADTVIALGPIALATQWYAASFPNGAFVVTDAASGLDAVYHQDDRALWLDGTASTREMPSAGKTLVVYADPLPALRFPIADGDAYTAMTAIDATINGLPFIGSDTLDIDVTVGRALDVPYVEFSPITRVRTHATRAASAGGVAPASTRTTSFLFECFGEVVHAASDLNEPNADFTTAASLRRFALGETP